MTPSNKPGRILPREGLHVGVLGALIRSTLLNPFLILPAVLLGRYTDSGRALALRNARLFSWLNAFAALGVVRVANSWLNRRALNNGVKDRFDWSREVVLLTGGSDGIGARVVQMLAERNIKVVVLDVQPLTFERRISQSNKTLNGSVSTLTPSRSSICSLLHVRHHIQLRHRGGCVTDSVRNGEPHRADLQRWNL